jgi:hypothetical protein
MDLSLKNIFEEYCKKIEKCVSRKVQKIAIITFHSQDISLLNYDFTKTNFKKTDFNTIDFKRDAMNRRV